MVVRWRWDQGRLQYFQFDNVAKIARTLSNLEDVILNRPGVDPLRTPLQESTGLPFHPASYRVWRNYARVFGCACLATSVGNRLKTTDLCRQLASSGDDMFVVDEYLAFLIPRFYFPSPVFQDYDNAAIQVFPFCVLLRSLLAKAQSGVTPKITLSEVFTTLVGNEMIGSESLSQYEALNPTDYESEGDELRQVRELLIFFSQFSYLVMESDSMYLDIERDESASLVSLERLATPIFQPRSSKRSQEILSIGTLTPDLNLMGQLPTRDSTTDIVFTEGKKSRVTHVRVERSRRLRIMLFRSLQPPILCDMCSRDLAARYPWAGNLFEVHHTLPLSSPLKAEFEGTSLSDLVALCPNCHRAVHVYYRNWLNDRGQFDFQSIQEAKEVYAECRRAVQL